MKTIRLWSSDHSHPKLPQGPHTTLLFSHMCLVDGSMDLSGEEVRPTLWPSASGISSDTDSDFSLTGMFPNRLTAGLCGASWKLREPYPGSLLGENLLSRKQMPEKPSPALSQPWGSRGQDSWSRTPGDLGAYLPVAGSE